MRNLLRHNIKTRLQRWLKQRLPRSYRSQLDQRNIFIMPSGFGLALMVLSLALFVLGTNYQNNLILGLCYLLISVFLLSMLHCFKNLYGLRIGFKDGETVEVNHQASVEMQLSHHRLLHALVINTEDNPAIHFVNGSNSELVKLSVSASQRGKYTCPRVTIKSYYPLGLFVGWTYVRPAALTWFYPEPITPLLLESDGEQEGEEEMTHQAQGDNFQGLERYQKGQSLARVAWKQLAQNRGMWQKEFDVGSSHPTALTLTMFSGKSLEEKLAQMTMQAIEYTRNGVPFSFSLGADFFPTANSERHLETCLQAIACYDQHSVS